VAAVATGGGPDNSWGKAEIGRMLVGLPLPPKKKTGLLLLPNIELLIRVITGVAGCLTPGLTVDVAFA
jgi:hypothetical protein